MQQSIQLLLFWEASLFSRARIGSGYRYRIRIEWWLGAASDSKWLTVGVKYWSIANDYQWCRGREAQSKSKNTIGGVKIRSSNVAWSLALAIWGQAEPNCSQWSSCCSIWIVIGWVWTVEKARQEESWCTTTESGIVKQDRNNEGKNSSAESVQKAARSWNVSSSSRDGDGIRSEKSQRASRSQREV